MDRPTTLVYISTFFFGLQMFYCCFFEFSFLSGLDRKCDILRIWFKLIAQDASRDIRYTWRDQGNRSPNLIFSWFLWWQDVRKIASIHSWLGILNCLQGIKNQNELAPSVGRIVHSGSQWILLVFHSSMARSIWYQLCGVRWKRYKNVGELYRRFLYVNFE